MLISLSCALIFFLSSRRRHTRCLSDWSSDVCSSDLPAPAGDIHPFAGFQAEPGRIMGMHFDGTFRPNLIQGRGSGHCAAVPMVEQPAGTERKMIGFIRQFTFVGIFNREELAPAAGELF